MVTQEYLIAQIDKYLTTPRHVSERLITSKLFSGWIQDRLKNDQQVLLQAIVAREGEMQNRINLINYQIQQEFNNLANVRILPFSCEDLEQLPILLTGLIKHFDSNLSSEDVIVKMLSHNTKAGDYTGYIIVTIVNTFIIE